MQAKSLILITRAQEDSERFRTLLDNAQTDITIIPFFDIESLTPPLIKSDKKYDGIIVTSHHTLPYLMRYSLPKSTPFYVVGTSTKQQLQALGYQNILACTQNVSDLNILLSSISQRSNFLYLRGKSITMDLKYALDSKHSIDEAIVYNINHITVDISTLKGIIQPYQHIIVPLFSNHTAQHVLEALEQLDTTTQAKITLIAMSHAIANTTKSKHWKNISIATTADLQSVAKMAMLAAHYL
jgi:uroporphyrinogen-III synthase